MNNTQQTIPVILTSLSLTVYLDGGPTTVLRSDPLFESALKAYKDGDYDALKRTLARQETVVEAIASSSDAAVEVKNGVIYLDGEAVSGTLHERMLEFLREQLPFQPLVEFLRRLRKNPSFRAQQALYAFMETNKHPILPDGCFLAYKRVKAPDASGAMWDIYTGKTHDNRPGSTPRMPRNKVNEDPNQTCSNGLHVANWDYAMNHFGGAGDVMVEVKVDPENVVAIPVDYNQAKMRTCGYDVLRVVEAPNPSTTLVREEEDKGGHANRFCDDENPCEDCDPTVCPDDCDCHNEYEDDEEYEEEEPDEEEEVEEDDGALLPAVKSDAGSDPLLRAIPTDALRSLLTTLLDSSDPKNAIKVAQITTELSRRP